MITEGGRDRVLVAATALVILAAACISAVASRSNSLTFDELVTISAGARGMATGDMSMTYDQPPAMAYLYGSAARIGGVKLPREAPGEWGLHNRYNYGQELFFRAGNDPERVAFNSRLAGVVVAIMLGALVASFAWRYWGPLAGFFSAAVVMLVPDVLAHAAIAYNDVPIALMFFLGLWAWDAAVRAPTVPRAALAGFVSGLAVGVKFSALALGPAAVLLFIAEAALRRRDVAWYKRILTLSPVALAAMWLALVIVYGGDPGLQQFRDGWTNQMQHIDTGHGVPTLLLGRVSVDGFWYFFPVAMVLKTPAALHALVVLAVCGFVMTWEPDGAKRVARSRLRVVLIGLVVYFALMMRVKLTIGVRHALPLIPLLAVLTGVGLARLWRVRARWVRVAAASLMVAYAASTLAYYPWFLSYLTEYVPDRRETGHRVLVDSNLDWGQGLLALRDFMREEKIDAVYLSYFGSALPEGYGIRYITRMSYLPLPIQPPLAKRPEWLVVSATNIESIYLPNNAFVEFRFVGPRVVLANSMYAFRLTPPPAAAH